MLALITTPNSVGTLSEHAREAMSMGNRPRDLLHEVQSAQLLKLAYRAPKGFW